MLKVRSKFVVVIAAAVGGPLLIACNDAQTKPAPAAQETAETPKAKTVTVKTTQELFTALMTARGGDTYLLAPGQYSALGLRGSKFSDPGVTIKSADPKNRATMAGIELADCSGLSFQDIEVTINQRTQTALNVNACSRVRLSSLDIHGPPGAQNGGLLFRNSTNVIVADSDFHDLGTAVRNVDSNHVTVSGSRFKDIRGDGIQTTGTSNITITGNHFTDFHTSPGDHPDAIQFFTVNQKAEVHDIMITDNVVVRGKGDITQGIFMGNEADLAYVDVTISGNKIIGAMWNGIAVGKGRNLSITNNIAKDADELRAALAACRTREPRRATTEPAELIAFLKSVFETRAARSRR